MSVVGFSYWFLSFCVLVDFGVLKLSMTLWICFADDCLSMTLLVIDHYLFSRSG